MLIGNPSDFAIEAMVEPDLKLPSAVWGRMCVRIGSITLGDYDDPYCCLYGARAAFDWHAKRQGRLWDDIFNDMSPEDIHLTVRNALYGDDDRTIDLLHRDSRRYGEFDFLTNWGEQFDGYSSVIVSPDPDTMMIIHRPYVAIESSQRLQESFVVARCSRSGFLSASAQFVEWFDREAQRLSLEE